MDKINFVNNSEPDISAENLNQMQTNIENAINDVVEKIENSNGTAIKFTDGTMICTKTVNFSNVDVTTQVGALYQSSQLNLGNWASNFIANPFSQATIVGGWAGWIYQHTNYNTTSAGVTTLLRPTSTSGSSNNFIVGVIAIGKWK